MRRYENAPMQQSIVSQVVFNQDAGLPKEGQLDGEATSVALFQGSAGRGSWEQTSQDLGVRSYAGGDTNVAAPAGRIAGAQASPRGQGLRTYYAEPDPHVDDLFAYRSELFTDLGSPRTLRIGRAAQHKSPRQRRLGGLPVPLSAWALA